MQDAIRSRSGEQPRIQSPYPDTHALSYTDGKGVFNPVTFD